LASRCEHSGESLVRASLEWPRKDLWIKPQSQKIRHQRLVLTIGYAAFGFSIQPTSTSQIWLEHADGFPIATIAHLSSGLASFSRNRRITDMSTAWRFFSRMDQLCGDYEGAISAAVVLRSRRMVVLLGKERLLPEYDKDNK
jgi:hypothetical protein